MFYVYDYKYLGEHRIRLVFDGSRQSATTYSITYAPTVRAESVRLFHLYAVEYSWPIQQYDVPQAFYVQMLTAQYLYIDLRANPIFLANC